jgi:hypothetical protein
MKRCGMQRLAGFPRRANLSLGEAGDLRLGNELEGPHACLRGPVKHGEMPPESFSNVRWNSSSLSNDRWKISLGKTTMTAQTVAARR